MLCVDVAVFFFGKNDWDSFKSIVIVTEYIYTRTWMRKRKFLCNFFFVNSNSNFNTISCKFTLINIPLPFTFFFSTQNGMFPEILERERERENYQIARYSYIFSTFVPFKYSTNGEINYIRYFGMGAHCTHKKWPLSVLMNNFCYELQLVEKWNAKIWILCVNITLTE